MAQLRKTDWSRMLALALAFCLALPQAAYAQEQYVVGADASDASGASTEDSDKASEPEYATVKQIKLNKKTVKLKNNATFKFKAKLVASVAGKEIKDTKIKWSISNTKVARIDQNGVVQGKKTGTATVTVKASNGKKAKARVKVKVNLSQIASAVPVLTYHRICSDSAKRKYYSDTNLAIGKSLFKRQMKWLVRNGYTTISTTEFRDWRLNGAFIPKKSVLITIDDGFYETYHVAYPVLKKYNLKATSFVIGKKVKKKTRKYDPNDAKNRYMGKDVIDKVRKNYPNLEFQSHTYNMHYRASNGSGIATVLSYSDIKKDFAKNAKFGFTSMAYPFGHTSKNLLACARANKSIKIGFGYVMTEPATRLSARYNIPRFKVVGEQNLSDFIRALSSAR